MDNGRLFDCLDKCFPGIKQMVIRGLEIGLRWESASHAFVAEKNGKVIAHAGVMFLPCMVNGEKKEIGGIHAVCTDPEFRNKGYSNAVVTEAVNFALKKCSTLMLFTGIPNFYKKWGFKEVPEHCFLYQGKFGMGSHSHKTYQLMATNPDHVSTAQKILASRAPLSKQFCVIDNGLLLLYAALSTYPYFNHLYFCPEIETIVAWQVNEKGTLKIFDVIAKELPSLDKLLSYVPKPVQQIFLYFSPDQLTSNAEPIPYVHEKGPHHFMVLGDWDVKVPCMVQSLSRC